MSTVIPATSYVAADEADPEILIGAADAAQVFGVVGRSAGTDTAWYAVVLGVAADGATATSPFFEAGAVEDVLAENGEEAGGLVHTLETDWTCR